MTRKPFSGVFNIIRFNWHFYAAAIVLILAGIILFGFLPHPFNYLIFALSLLAGCIIFISIFVSWYIYDHSNLYTLKWIDELTLPIAARIANINAGFDETSALLKYKYPDSLLDVFDFYDPVKHTEISIERARKAYPEYTGTKQINTSNTKLAEKAYDIIFLILAVHEIRNNNERTDFFKQLALALNPKGRIIVVEHQRDFINFIAFNIGYLHFFSPAEWIHNFENSGLRVNEIKKLTPFLKIYNLSVK
ncbi:MAG: methyltransferase [Ignavibacteria bacterium]|nr:methyltransferase [Ignavibacteria bacterium]